MGSNVDLLEPPKLGNPKLKSRSFQKSNNILRVIQDSYKTVAYIENILTELPKGESNSKPSTNQVQYRCSYLWLNGYVKRFCLSKKWWYLCPIFLDQEIDLKIYHWSNVLNLYSTSMKNIQDHSILYKTPYACYTIIMFTNMVRGLPHFFIVTGINILTISLQR